LKKSYIRRNIKTSKTRHLPIFKKQFFKGSVFLIVFSLIIIFIFGDHGIVKLYKIKNERIIIQKKIAELRKEREKLKNQKIEAENDLGYIEKIAREKYKMVKPGEKLFKIINN
jgi:cell division protein FtsB